MVSDLSSDIEVFIPMKLEGKTKNEINFPVNPGNETMTLHKFEIPYNDTAFHVRIEPLNETILTIYLRYGERPNRTNYDFSFTIPDFSSCLPPEEENCTVAFEFMQCLNISHDTVRDVESYVDPTNCPPIAEQTLPPLPTGEEVEISTTEPKVIYPCPASNCTYENYTYENCSCTMIPRLSFLLKDGWSNAGDDAACQRLRNFVICPKPSGNCSEENCTRDSLDQNSDGEREHFRNESQNLCGKNEVNFLSCYPNVTRNRFETCKEIFYKPPKLFYGEYGKCLQDPFKYYFPPEDGRAGDYFVAITYYTPPVQVEMNTSLLKRYREELLRNASMIIGYNVSWEECEIEGKDCSELLDSFEQELEDEQDEIEGNKTKDKTRKRRRRRRRNRRKRNRGDRDRRSVSTIPEDETPGKRICAVVKEKPPPPKPSNELETEKLPYAEPEYEPNISTLYTFEVNLFNCLFWDEENERWSTLGCRVRL